MVSSVDYEYMARAIRLAKRGLYTTDPNPRVGCVLVREGVIVGEGWHVRAGGPHAEVIAMQQANGQEKDSTAYVSLEPCSHHGRTPPCSEALLAAGIRRVVVAMQDPNPKVAGAGIAQLKAAGIEVEVGILEDQAKALNPGFISRMQRGRPFVRSKLATSLDGRTAMANGESQWITSAEARHDVHRLRARSSAIVTGIGTVLADDPSLTARLADATEVIQPVRVVVDSQLRMPCTAKLFQQEGETWVFTHNDNATAIKALESAGARVFVSPARQGRIDLSALLKTLAEQQINEVMIEAGTTLNGALLQAGLIDEWIWYMAPKIMGDSARGAFHLPGLMNMTDSVVMDISDVRRIGQDWRITGRIAK